MRRVGIGLAVGVAARSAQPSVEPPRLVSMTESGQAMQRAGETMQAHAQAMLTEGQRAGDQELLDHGNRWLGDGQALVRGGQWMGMNPTSPASQASSPSELAAQGNWGELTRTAQAMLHDPSQARSVDLEALRWNGLAMRSEGRNVGEHGRVMAEQVEVMVARHGLEGQAVTDLRQTAAEMQQVGGFLEQNGEEMVDYAGRLRRSLGYS